MFYAFNYGLFKKRLRQLLKLVEQDLNTMFSILGNTSKLELPVDLQFQMFDNIVTSIILYSAESFGY